MKVIITPTDALAAAPHWDVLEWDDAMLATNSDARGLFVRMFAQSLNEWAAQRELDDKLKASRMQREAAKEEVEVEAQRVREGEGFNDGHG